MINLKTLIQAAPFPEETKRELVEKADSFSSEKKFELLEMCWALISTDYQNKLSYELQKATLETASGQKTYSQEDFKKIEENLFMELASKLEAEASQEQMNGIRQQLASQTQNNANLSSV